MIVVVLQTKMVGNAVNDDMIFDGETLSREIY